ASSSSEISSSSLSSVRFCAASFSSSSSRSVTPADGSGCTALALEDGGPASLINEVTKVTTSGLRRARSKLQGLPVQCLVPTSGASARIITAPQPSSTWRKSDFACSAASAQVASVCFLVLRSTSSRILRQNRTRSYMCKYSLPPCTRSLLT